MATSIRYITYGEIELTAETVTDLDIDLDLIPESTVFLEVFADPDNTLPVFFLEPNAFETLGGVILPAGQARVLGPFLLANIPLLYCEAAAAVLVTIVPVVSER